MWLLLHASRFGSTGSNPTDCALEQWRNACREQGTRARETLRGGVEAALLELGQGFVSHPANTALRDALVAGTLSSHEYLRELLRLVYRQIFLLTVEEREILHRSDADPGAVALYADGYSKLQHGYNHSKFDSQSGWYDLQRLVEWGGCI
jgi:hypothetical protein